MQRAFEMTVEWAFDRYSFGRPLASYQALKHRFADMATWLEASHAISDAAARAVAEDAPRPGKLVSAAKAYIGRVRRRAAAGMRAAPRRHRRHVRARPAPVPARVTLDARLLGTPAEHRPRVADLVRAGGGTRARRSSSRRSRRSANARALDPRATSAGRADERRHAARRSSATKQELADVARDRELQRMLFDAGLAGICVPREYGGQGLTPAHQHVLNEELRGYEYPARSRCRRCPVHGGASSSSAPRSRSDGTFPRS